MLDRKRFFRDGALLTAVGIAMRTVGLLFSTLLSRAAGAEGVGLHTLVMTVYGFAVTFATSGISLTVTRLVAGAIGEGRREACGRILAGAMLYALLFSGVATTVLLVGAELFAVRLLGDARATLCLRILSPSLIPLALVSVLSGYFVGIRRVTCNAVTQVVTHLFRIGVTVLLLLRCRDGDVGQIAAALAMGTTLTECAGFAVILIEYRLFSGRAITWRGASVGEVAASALPLALSAYIRQALLTLEHMLIPRQLQRRGQSHAEALAAYGTLHGMALPMLLYPMTTLSSFSGLLVPEFAGSMASGDRARMERITAAAFHATSVYATVCAVLLGLFAEEIGYAFYRSYSAGCYLSVLAPVVPIMYLDHVGDSILKGIGEQVYSMWVNITDALLSVALVWLLLPRMGILGYAVVIVVMEGYNFALSLHRLRRRIVLRYSPLRSLLLPALSAGVAAGISRSAFCMGGAQTGVMWLLLKMLFAVSLSLAIYTALSRLLARLDRLRGSRRDREGEIGRE